MASDAQVKAVSSRVSNLASLEAKEDKKLSGEAAAAEWDQADIHELAA